MANNVTIDTNNLKHDATRLENIRKSVSSLDSQISRLYWKTGNQDLLKIMRPNTIYVGNKKIKNCINALNNTANEFEDTEKTVQSGGLLLGGLDSLKYATGGLAGRIRYVVADLISDVGSAVQKRAPSVRSCIASLVESYYSEGWVYKTVQYGKAVVKAAKGVKKIVAGVGSIVGTGGLAAPIAILSIVSGANDVINSLVDGAYIYAEDYDNVGKTNVLKDYMVDKGEELGGMLGNKQAGNTFANIAYYGIDIVTSLGTVQSKHYLDQLKQTTPTDKTKLFSEIKEIFSLDVSNVRVDAYGMKLMSYAYSETTNAITNAGLFVETVKECVGVAKKCSNAYSELVGNFKNPVVDFLDTIDGVGKGAKLIGKILK